MLMNARFVFFSVTAVAIGSLAAACSASPAAEIPDPTEETGTSEAELSLCKKDKCGPALGMPTIVCSDGSLGGNTGRWSFFGNPDNTIEQVEPSGGRPGAWWHSTCGGFDCLDTFAPGFRTEEGTSSIFTGDYRGRGVRGLGIDAAVLGPEFVSTGDRPLTLMLRHDPDTPEEFSD